MLITQTYNGSIYWGGVKREVYRKIRISEMDISEIGCISDTSDDVISDMSISDISIAKMDISVWTYRSGHIGNLNTSDFRYFRYL
jgi:hypothetical protein